MNRLALAPTALALCLSLATTAPAQPVNPAPVAADSTDFVIKAAQSDEFERQEGQLAQQKGRHSEVRAFGAQMVHDHTQSTEDLRDAMRRAGMPPPPPPSLNPEQARMLSDLEGATGPAFDHMYADQQVIAHRQAESLMRDYSENGPPGPVREAASHALPMVEHHLGTAMKLAQQLATS